MSPKVAIITGSSSGIGEATAYLFATKGYQVVVHGSSNQEKVDKVVAKCNSLSPNGSQALGLISDFNNPDVVDLLVTKTIEKYGQLDVLINNAGFVPRPSSHDANDMYDTYRKTMTVNLDSTVKLTYAAIKYLQQSKDNPSIIFISSVGSQVPSAKASAYCMSKASMSMFAKCLAIDLAPTIRCNIVSPGPIFTPLFGAIGLYNEIGKQAFSATTLIGRMGETSEVAEAIYYLCSDQATWITGTDFKIDGGYTLSDKSIARSATSIKQS